MTMYNDMDKLENDFNIKITELKQSILDTEVFIRELFKDSYWDEDDCIDIIDSMDSISDKVKEIKDMLIQGE